jgi:hypothetical protein
MGEGVFICIIIALVITLCLMERAVSHRG